MNEATFAVGPEDLIAANRFHFKNLFSAEKWTFTLLGTGTAIALILYGLDLGFDVRDFLYIFAAVWTMIVGICALGWFLIPRQARRSWSQAKRLWIETEVRWDKDGIHFKNARGDSYVPWSDYHRWAADKRSILLYQDDRSFILLPLRGFPADARETITGHLKTSGVPTR